MTILFQYLICFYYLINKKENHLYCTFNDLYLLL